MSTEEDQLAGDFWEAADDPAVVYRAAPGERNSEAVVAAVSSVSGIDETELTPIYEVVDPEALDSLFRARGGIAADGHVAFEYESYRVRVESDGTVFVH
jgi:hypothetical protein